MADPHEAPSGDTPSEDTPLNERLLELFVYVPAGFAVTVVEELPKLAARGKERLGVKVSSARAVGQFVVQAGTDEVKRRSAGLIPGAGRSSATPPRPTGTTGAGSSAPAGPRAVPTPHQPPVRIQPPAANGHVPEVSTLSIPGFDTLSASQVVQRLDGLNRSELVSVRAYEASTRGRRTILSRVDQLLDERS
jgi:hypothetical protein